MDDLEEIILNEISLSQKDKYYIIPLYIGQNQRQKVESWLPGAGGRGHRGCCLMGTESQSRKMRKVLERDGGDGRITM